MNVERKLELLADLISSRLLGGDSIAAMTRELVQDAEQQLLNGDVVTHSSCRTEGVYGFGMDVELVLARGAEDGVPTLEISLIVGKDLSRDLEKAFEGKPMDNVVSFSRAKRRRR